MSDSERDRRIAETFEKFRSRQRAGAEVDPEQYASDLGDAYGEFLGVVEGHRALEALLEPVDAPVPRAFGRYELLREIGRGASGIVYEARDLRTDLHVAVKILRTDFDAAGEAGERFRREASACGKVHHRNVVRVLDFGQVDDRLYVAMELLDGPSLRALIRQRKQPPPQALCVAFADLADALAAVHEAGVVHRDVKPSNILVAPDGRFVLADFGLARCVASGTLTSTGAALGSPLYMSPEQMLGTVDARTDVYGLGATLYEALTGKPVFDAASVASLAEQVRSRRPVPARRLVPGLPPEYDDVLLKALEKRREDRYQTAAEMRDDLRALGASRTPRGRPVSRTLRVARYVRRQWPLMAVAAVILAGTAWRHLTRPASVSVTTYPTARIFVDGVDQGETPCHLDLPAGVVELRLERPRFATTTLRLELRRGQSVASLLCLVPARPDDPEALRELADALGTRMRLPPDAAPRSTQQGIVAQAVYPAGRVRVADLRRLRFELLVPEAFATGGALEFVKNGRLLHSEPLAIEHVATELPVPRPVREAVAPGDHVVWGYRASGGDAFTAEFEVVADDPSLTEALARADGLLAAHAGGTRTYLDGLLLLDRGLATAAIEQATAEAEGGSLPANVLVYEALRSIERHEGLMGTAAWTVITSQPPEKRAAWLRGP